MESQPSHTLIGQGDEIFHLTEKDLKFPEKLSLVILGPSNSGKSDKIRQIIKHRKKLCAGNITKIIYTSPNLHSQSKKDIEYHHELRSYGVICKDELPTADELNGSFLPENNNERSLIVIDDMANSAFGSDKVRDIYERLCNHHNIDVILSTQSFFKNKEKYFQDILRSSSLICITNVISDKAMVQNFARKFGLAKTIPPALKTAVRLEGSRGHILIFCSYDSALTDQFPVRTGYFENYLNPSLSFKPIFFKTLD